MRCAVYLVNDVFPLTYFAGVYTVLLGQNDLFKLRISLIPQGNTPDHAVAEILQSILHFTLSLYVVTRKIATHFNFGKGIRRQCFIYSLYYNNKYIISTKTMVLHTPDN